MIVAAILPLALTLAMAPAASGATLFANFTGAGGSSGAEATQTTWLAQPFVPTSSGTARLASFVAVAYFGETATPAISIYTHSTAGGGQPGTVLATGTVTVGDSTGPTAACAVLGTPTALTAGQTYWAVVRSTTNKTTNWLFNGQGGVPTTNTRVSTNSGGTWAARPPGAEFSVRIDDNTTCSPEITTIPNAGGGLDDMYAKPGGASFQTLTASNSGTQELTLTGGSFSGPNASMFSLRKGEPGGPEDLAFTFPKSVGTGGGVIFVYIHCRPPLGTLDGEKTATLTLTTNDPDEGSISWPVWCLVDSTPPSLEFTQNPNGRSGWFVTQPAPLQVRGIDPESGNRVKRIFCSDNGVPSLDWPSGSIASFGIQPDGVHGLSCQGTDVANNTSAPGAYTTTVKVDSTAPETTQGDGGPPAVSDVAGPFAFSFAGSDGGSGLQEFECRLDSEPYGLCTSPASRNGLANGAHTFDVRARDVAGNYDPAPVRWSWEVNVPPPPPGAGGNPAGVIPLGDTLAPVVSKPKLRKRKLTFALSEAARTTVVVNEIRKGRKKPIRRGKVNHAGRRGSNTLAISKKLLKKKRRYRLTITAVDAAGNASKAKSIKVRVR